MLSLPWRSQATTTTTTPASVDSSYAFFKLADVDRRLRCAAWDAGCNVDKPTIYVFGLAFSQELPWAKFIMYDSDLSQDPRDCYLPQNMSAEYYNYSESIVHLCSS